MLVAKEPRPTVSDMKASVRHSVLKSNNEERGEWGDSTGIRTSHGTVIARLGQTHRRERKQVQQTGKKHRANNTRGAKKREREGAR